MVAVALLVPLALLVSELAQERALAQAERRSAIAATLLAVTTNPDAVEQVIATTQGEDAGRLAIHGLDGATIGAGHANAEDIALAGRQRQAALVSVPDGLAYLEPVEVAGGEVAVVEVYIPSSDLTAGVHAAWWSLAAVAIGLVVGSAVVGDRFATRIVRPARNLAAAATAFGDGDHEVRVHPSGPRELAEAGAAFNQMADRLETMRVAEREMVADLSHRLRTPLTGLRLDVEALDASDPMYGAIDDADRHRTVRRIRQAIATLEAEIDVLIQTTRTAANAAASSSTPEPARCDASEVVAERMVFWGAVAADQQRPCEVLGTHTPAPVPVPASELAAALDAILGNAFRYTPQGTALEVAVSRHDGWVAVRVDDAGSGIADPERALRRGSSDQGSTGLGLDIAMRVAKAGGGSLSIDRARLGGASVVMVFADADAKPRQPSRFGLIGRLTREPRRGHARRWPQRRRRKDRRRQSD